MTDAAIVIVAYNSERDIGPCVDSALRSGAEVIVVDNNSSDRTRDEVLSRSAARLIANPWNRGFAGGVNQGLAVTNKRYILLLNPDAEILYGFDQLVQACRDGAFAAAGGKLVDSRGNPQAGFQVRRFPGPGALVCEVLGLNRVWPDNPVNRHYRCLDLDPEAPAAVDQPAGAFLMIDREVWRATSGFDETFHPLWFEDVDYCKRVRAAGYKIGYIPGAVARHKGGYSVQNLSWDRKQQYWYGNLLKYAGTHFGPLAFRAVCLSVIAGSVLRAIAGCFLLRSVIPLSSVFRVVRLAGLYLVSGRSGEVSLSSAI